MIHFPHPSIRLMALALLLALSGCSGVTYDPGPANIEAPPPPPPSAGVATLGGQKYAVISGDTIDSVARQFGVPVDVLIQANGLVSPYELRPGQQLLIPVSGSYIVAPGDSLYRIAKQHGTTVAALAQANGIAPPYKIRVGQQLTLPGGAVDSGSVAEGITMPPAEPGPTLPVASGTKVTTETLAPPPGVAVSPAPAGAAPAGSSTAVTTVPPLSGGSGVPAAAATTLGGSSTAVTTLPPPVNSAALPPAAPTDTSGTAPALAPLPPPPAAATSLPPAPAPGATASTTIGSDQAAALSRQPAGHGSGKFLWPVNGKIVSPFGAKDGGLHNDGINIAAPLGTPVRAADNGVVVYAGNELKGFGNLLLVRHADGWVSAYAHCDALLVKRGDNVKRGQVIGRVGQSGNVTAPQLHFELRKGAEAVDPLSQLGPQGA
jgi:murein DD-endopeptidase MepM/ murein hydrolase activator NlpD